MPINIVNSESDSEAEPSEIISNDVVKSSSDSAVSLLSRLRSPTPSDLARKRKRRQNSPPVGLKRYCPS